MTSQRRCSREYLRVVENEPVPLAEIIDYILEKTVLDLAAVLVQDHQAALIPPQHGLLRYLLLREVEIEL